MNKPNYIETEMALFSCCHPYDGCKAFHFDYGLNLDLTRVIWSVTLGHKFVYGSLDPITWAKTCKIFVKLQF